jgi:hypothetical protein
MLARYKLAMANESRLSNNGQRYCQRVLNSVDLSILFARTGAHQSTLQFFALTLYPATEVAVQAAPLPSQKPVADVSNTLF